MSSMQRFCQGPALRHAAAAWRAGATQMQAARVVMSASQRFAAAAPAQMANQNPVPSFSSSSTIPMSFAASGVQPTTAAASGTSGSVEGSDSGESGNSMSGASHTGSLSEGTERRRRRKRF